MKLQNTTEYGLRILIYMAKEPSKLYTAGSLVEYLEISNKYLRRIMSQLSKLGYIRSVQGKDGGYYLDRKLEDISIADVVNSFEGLEKFSGCILGFSECSDNNPCAFHNHWASVRANILETLKGTKFNDLELERILKF